MSEPEPTVGAFTRHDAYLLALRLLAEHAEALIDGQVISWLGNAEYPHRRVGRALEPAELAVVVHFLEHERDRLLETIARHEAQRT